MPKPKSRKKKDPRAIRLLSPIKASVPTLFAVALLTGAAGIYLTTQSWAAVHGKIATRKYTITAGFQTASGHYSPRSCNDVYITYTQAFHHRVPGNTCPDGKAVLKIPVNAKHINAGAESNRCVKHTKIRKTGKHSWHTDFIGTGAKGC